VAGAEQAPVVVVGGGVAGLSAACALAEAGHRVQIIERRSYLGGRAASFRHPGADEVIDNCQHVLFGCCTNLSGFYRRIGVTDRIRWTSDMTMIEPGGRASRLGPSPLPAPLHSLPRFLAASAFTWADKLALARAFRALLEPIPSESRESLGDWLKRQKQTPGALNRFWRLVIASALNADLDTIALPYAAKVIRELFLSSAEAGRMGMSTVPLGALYAEAEKFLTARGSAVVYNTRVEGGTWDPAARRWTLTTALGPLFAEQVILALPYEATARLLPHFPAAPGVPALATQLEQQEHWPICSVHLWFDRAITDLDHAVLLDREIHWMYNKTRLDGARCPQRAQPRTEFQPESGLGLKRVGDNALHHLELVVSASRSFAALRAEEAIARAHAELAEFFPAVRSAVLVKSAFIKEVHATFGVTPGIDAARPGSRSPWPQCFLAGDWTATGWPSTMESAARSGHLAAEALSRSLGQSKAWLEPDLPPQGLMRWLDRNASTASSPAGSAPPR
jgi:zeta-carotene desaturase